MKKLLFIVITSLDLEIECLTLQLQNAEWWIGLGLGYCVCGIPT